MRVTVWNENVHEGRDESVQRVPGRHSRGCCRRHQEGTGPGCRRHDRHAGSARARPAGRGRPGDRRTRCWWSHIANDQLCDEVVDRVIARVERGMGLVLLHSACYSRVSLSALGTSCALDRWAPDNEQQVWTVKAGHPITARGALRSSSPRTSCTPSRATCRSRMSFVFISSYSGGAVFRSGCCFRRGDGRIFYFSPGDQQYPVYRQSEVRKVIANAVAWVAPRGLLAEVTED